MGTPALENSPTDKSRLSARVWQRVGRDKLIRHPGILPRILASATRESQVPWQGSQQGKTVPESTKSESFHLFTEMIMERGTLRMPKPCPDWKHV